MRRIRRSRRHLRARRTSRGTASPAGAGGRRASPHVRRRPPTSRHWRIRARTTGVSATSFRRPTSRTGDACSCSATPVTTACVPTGVVRRLVAFGNNSAWLQHGGCFTLLDNSRPGWCELDHPAGRGRQRLLARRSRGRRQSIARLPRAHAARPVLRNAGRRGGRNVRAALARTRADRDDPVSRSDVLRRGRRVRQRLSVHVRLAGPDCVFCAGPPRARTGARGPPAGSERMAVLRGRRWTSDPNASVPVLPNSTSQPDVQPWNNGFLLVTKPLNILTVTWTAWWAPNPDRALDATRNDLRIPLPPQSHIPGQVYNSPFTYMASLTASAAVAGGGRLLAYNVNSFDDADRRATAAWPAPVSYP